MRKFLYTVLGLALLVVGAQAATNLSFTFGTTWVPSGPALFQGQDFQTLTNAVNTLRNQVDGTTAGVFKGSVTPTTAMSPRNIATCANPAKVSTDGTDATPVITEVYIGELSAPATTSATGLAVMNGSVASGNIKVGLANSAGTVVATSASTAMSGTDTYQLIPFTAPVTLTGPATYYALEFIDNTTARYNTLTFGTCGAAKQTGQTYATGFTTITPPTTFTTALGPIANLY